MIQWAKPVIQVRFCYQLQIVHKYSVFEQIAENINSKVYIYVSKMQME